MEEVHDLRLGPETVVVAVPRAEKSAVAAVFGFYEGDVGIARDLPAGRRQNADEWIVRSVHDQSGHSYFVDHIRGRRTCVVIVRAVKAAIEGGDLIVEITGDCPLVDAKLVDRAIEEFFSKEVDYAANCLHQSFPLGFEVQVFPTSVLAEVDRLTQDPVDRTHVSYYIYTHPEKFRLHSWEAAEGERGSEMRVTLDEPEDYEVLNRIFEELLPSGQTFGARDVVALLKSRPDIQSLNENIRQKEASEG